MFKKIIFCLLLVCFKTAYAEKITIAAAADLKFAMDEIVSSYLINNPQDDIQVALGSSGKFYTQIQNGAPFDLFFSADIEYPKNLQKQGFSATAVKPYAFGRLVIWSKNLPANKMTAMDLNSQSIKKIAIANPAHAPYGKRAEEALRSVGIWEQVKDKLVMGENISQTAVYVETGNADIGLIALSLALSPSMTNQGSYSLIPDKLHKPLEQGYIVTKRAESNPVAKRFSLYMDSKQARQIMVRYGFVLPSDTKISR